MNLPSKLGNERKRRAMVGCGIAGLVVLLGLVSISCIYFKVTINNKKDEAICKEYGNKMGYNIEYSHSTCFVYMDYGVTVPLDIALPLQQAIFLDRQETAKFKKSTK